MRKFSLLFLCLMLTLLVGCGDGKSSKTNTDQLIIGTAQQFESLDFIISEMSATSYLHGFTNRGLVRYDENWKMVTALSTGIPSFENGLAQKYMRENVPIFELPAKMKEDLNNKKINTKLREKFKRDSRTLAEDAKISKLIADKEWYLQTGDKEYKIAADGDELKVTCNEEIVKMTWELKEGLKWGDGQPLVVDDFILTWKIGCNDMVRVGSRENYTDIIDIEKIDDRKFIIHKKDVDYQYNRVTEEWFKPLPSHIMGKILEKPLTDPEDYEKRSPYTNTPLNPGLYNGPYLLKELELGSHMILEANPHFYGSKPKIKRIIVRLIEDTSTLEANLLSGTIEYIPGEVGNLSIDQGLSFEKRHDKRGFNVAYKPGLIYEHMDVNHENPILADKRVRQALMYGMNRKVIVDTLFQGKIAIAHSNISPLDSIYYDGLKKYQHNPEKANSLLSEAGWNKKSDGSEWKSKADGIRYNDKGEKLELLIMTTAGNKTRELVQQVLQADWKEIGISINIKNEPARVYFGQTIKKGKFPGLALFAWISSPENFPKTTLHSSNIPRKESGFMGQNDGKYSNVKMDKAIEDCEFELVFEKRTEHWKTIQEIYAEDLPALPLYFRADVFIMPKWLKNVKPTGNQYASSYKAEEWEIVLEKKKP